jgi:hypothetical protein
MTGGHVIYGTLVGVGSIKAVWVKPKAFGLVQSRDAAPA